MQDLKDVAAEDQWHNDLCEDQGTFLNMVQVSGITMNKLCAITQHFQYMTSASSTDRLHHMA
jgi:hypothetical protein